MFYTSALFYRYCTFFLLLLLISSCHRDQMAYQTDIDNLYAIKRTPAQKEEIFKKYEADVTKILELPQTQEHHLYLDSIVNQLRWAGNASAFFSVYDLVERDAKKSKDYIRLARLYENAAVFYHDNEQLDSVYSFYLKAEPLYAKSGDSLALAENIYYQARLLYNVGFDNESEAKLYKSLRILKNSPLSSIYIESNQLQSFFLVISQKHQEALAMLFDIYEKLKNDEGQHKLIPAEVYHMAISNLLGNIGMSYLELEQYDQAEHYFLEALAHFKQGDNPIQLYALINANYYYTLYLQGKKTDVIPNLIESYTIFKELNHSIYAIDICDLISIVLLDDQQPEAALEWLYTGYQLADQSKLYKQKKGMIESMLTFFPSEQTPARIQELIDLSYFIEEQEKETKESFAKIEYKTLMIAKENEALKQKIYSISLAALLAIGGLLFGLIFIRLKNKNRELEHANSQKSKNEQILNLLVENNTIENSSILKERNRIAKDLHDGVINSIFTLRFNTQLLEDPNEKLKGMLVEELIQLENKVRNISHSFAQQQIFQDKSFEKLLVELVSKQSNKNKTKFSIFFEPNLSLEHLTTVQKVNIYQIIQEAFQNVNKHANASLCKLKISLEAHNILFKIQDNGKGFKRTAHRGIGLTNMKERAQLIEAELSILSNPQTGTEISLQLS
ncbi:sensor histidine kinase [Myroides sp. C15-4]|uniref:ATP-binding protein n=1 Tax=Myroides sp. C15-4 TaxID=3400532 RepID=UPI003D2F82F5